MEVFLASVAPSVRGRATGSWTHSVQEGGAFVPQVSAPVGSRRPRKGVGRPARFRVDIGRGPWEVRRPLEA